MGSLADEMLHAFEIQSVFHEDIGKLLETSKIAPGTRCVSEFRVSAFIGGS
jgi:hypothetical protein